MAAQPYCAKQNIKTRRKMQNTGGIFSFKATTL